MNVKPTRADAMQLLMEGAKALAQMEVNGICIDMEYLKKAEKQVQQKIFDLEDELRQDEVYKLWEKIYGSDMKLNSDKQLGFLFFERLGFEPLGHTASGLYKTDKNTFDHIDHPFAKKYITWKELQKALRTYIRGYIEETIDGFIHPHFNLHTVKSYRSSCTTPNVQNIPTRNPWVAEIIRRAVIPRPGNVIVECDLNMHEVRISTCYNKDKELIRYCTDPNADMHRDQTVNLFLLPLSEISKDIRFYTKNQFVFAQFFGSFFKQCAPLLWESMERFGLKTVSGKLLRDHLRDVGVKELGHCNMDQDDPRSEVLPGTFEHVVMKAEKELWNQFHQYAAWKKSWWEEYCKKGYFDFLNGFRASGVMKKNEVLNFAIQGLAFHCLLWILIEMHKWLKKNKMKTLIINEVHDSLDFDSPPNEVVDVISQVRYLAEEAIRKIWTFLIVPLKIEAEVCQNNWFEKIPFDPKKWRA